MRPPACSPSSSHTELRSSSPEGRRRQLLISSPPPRSSSNPSAAGRPSRPCGPSCAPCSLRGCRRIPRSGPPRSTTFGASSMTTHERPSAKAGARTVGRSWWSRQRPTPHAPLVRWPPARRRILPRMRRATPRQRWRRCGLPRRETCASGVVSQRCASRSSWRVLCSCAEFLDPRALRRAYSRRTGCRSSASVRPPRLRQARARSRPRRQPPASTRGPSWPRSSIRRPTQLVDPGRRSARPRPRIRGLLSQVITFTSNAPSNAVYGGSYLPVAQGGASGNPVLFTSVSTGVCKSVVGSTFDFVGVGSCLIQASEAGNSRYNSATSAQSFTVGQASQKIVFTSQPSNPTYNGPSYTVTATAPGGAVTFSAADSSGQACTVFGGGNGEFRRERVTASSTPIRVAVSITCLHRPGSAEVLVAKATQTVTITSTSPCNPCSAQMQYTLSGTASSGLAVTFGIDTSQSTPGSCSISGNVVTLNGGQGFPGMCVIEWFQNGDQNWAAAPAQSQSITIS